MSNNEVIAKKIASILKILAKKIEENPDLINVLGFNNVDIPVFKKNKRTEIPLINFDIFQVFAEGGEVALRDRLEKFDIISLKEIISKHSFDSSKLALKWKNKDRILSFIIDRVSSRSDKGKVFKEY